MRVNSLQEECKFGTTPYTSKVKVVELPGLPSEAFAIDGGAHFVIQTDWEVFVSTRKDLLAVSGRAAVKPSHRIAT